jgi:hypothetical protein
MRLHWMKMIKKTTKQQQEQVPTTTDQKGSTSQDDAATTPALAHDEKTPPAWMVRRDKIRRAKQQETASQARTSTSSSNTSFATTTIKYNSTKTSSRSCGSIVGCDVNPSNDDTKKNHHKAAPSDRIIVHAHLLRYNKASHTTDHGFAGRLDGSTVGKHSRSSRGASSVIAGGNWWDVPMVPLERPVGDVFSGNRLQ